MYSICKSKGNKFHTRNIEVTTYDYDGERIIVEGFLKDDRFQESHLMSGEKLPCGVVHHMSIRLMINCSNLMIEDVDVDLISVPREECRENIGCLDPIKGLTITSGFTLKVKKIAGGKKGCTHLVELLHAMAPAVIQGYASYQSKTPAVFGPERAEMYLHFLINTCRAWREDGPLVEKFKKMFAMK